MKSLTSTEEAIHDYKNCIAIVLFPSEPTLHSTCDVNLPHNEHETVIRAGYLTENRYKSHVSVSKQNSVACRTRKSSSVDQHCLTGLLQKICLFVIPRERNKSRFLELVMFGNLHFIPDNI
jgi:alpha-L-arabinofuranosidase